MALKDEYFTVAQAAKKLGVTRQTVYRWIAEGKIPTEIIGREVLIKKDEVERYGQFTNPIIKKFYEIVIDEVRKRRGYVEDDILTPVEIREGENKESFAEVVLGVKRKSGKSEMVYVDIGKTGLKRFFMGEGLLDIEIKQIRVE
jgi:excisionase family DNA binding protein